MSPSRRFETTLDFFHYLEVDPRSTSVVRDGSTASFDLLTLNVEHTVKQTVVVLRGLLQASGYPAVVLLQERGLLPSRLALHYLCWHTFRVVSSSSTGVGILVRRDSQPHIGDSIHHPEGKPIVLELVYRGTPI